MSRADVTISDEQVMYPKVTQAHVLVCMHQKALTATLGLIRPGGLLIADGSEVTVDRSTDARYFELPLSQTVLSELGSTRSANICMLGALVSLTRVVAPESIRAAVADRFRSAEEALAAFELGRSMVQGQVLSQTAP